MVRAHRLFHGAERLARELARAVRDLEQDPEPRRRPDPSGRYARHRRRRERHHAAFPPP
ncbi:hypothetical protein [Actinomadura sediminis]|uniref:Uncharacterized protein n=1 Tax=Actinomadura sediminis TaxID=1038904 RepID=A0ABW3ER00_9ACTN